MEIKEIGIASDHAGYKLKELLKDHLSKHFSQIMVHDMGCFSEESCDYSDFGHKLANEIEGGKYVYGIAICGSGNGINMTLNKHQKIRSAICWNSKIALLAREHNDANVCTLPGRFVTEDDALDIIEVFLTTDFLGERHLRRIQKIPLA